MNPLRSLPLAASLLYVVTLPTLCAAAQTVKDVALDAARKFDADRNGKISGGEMMPLRAAFKNPKSYLYLFDDNSNHYLEDAEIAKIQFAPAPKPAATTAPKSFWKTPPAGSKQSTQKRPPKHERKKK